MASIFKLALTSLAAVALTSTVAVAKPGFGNGQQGPYCDPGVQGCPYYANILAPTGSVEPRAALRLDRKVLDFLIKQPTYSKDVQSVYELEDILYGEMRVLHAFENAAEPSANDIRKQAANVIKIKKQIIALRTSLLNRLLEDQATLDLLFPKTEVEFVEVETAPVAPQQAPVQAAPVAPQQVPVQAAPQSNVNQNLVDSIDAPVPAQQPLQQGSVFSQPQEFPK